MAPKEVLDFPNTTANVMTTTTNNNLSAYIVNTSVVKLASFFGAFQQTTVRSNDVKIRTIVSPPISYEFYRKTMAIILNFCHIISLSNFPSISLSGLTTTVALYFDMNTKSTEREAERVVEPIYYTCSMLLTFRTSVLLILLVNIHKCLIIVLRMVQSLSFVSLLVRSTLISVFRRKSFRFNFR